MSVILGDGPCARHAKEVQFGAAVSTPTPSEPTSSAAAVKDSHAEEAEPAEEAERREKKQK
jgi:hypothetical protein